MVPSISILIASEPSENSSVLQSHIHAAFDSTVHQTQSLSELYDCLEKEHPDILVVDTSSPVPELGISLIKRLRNESPSLLILPLISTDRRQLIQQLLSLNVQFYIHTPLEAAETTLTLTRATEYLQTHRRVPSAELKNDNSECFHGMIGGSSIMQNLFELIRRVADDDESTVLIRGESGTGKEMVAKAIHSRSARASKNFVPVNCAAIPDDLLESELFGYTKGAFTGATSNKIGRIQYAEGGTLFLDEIGDMKPSLQAKLLRVLQEKEFEPVGALKSIPVDTRVLAATHCDLEHLVSVGEFREDLYYRLSVIPVNIPSLKERREDIPQLIERFVRNFTEKRNREPFTFSTHAYNALINFEWRGNVRELENLIQHMSIIYSGKEIHFDDLPEKFLSLKDLVESAEQIKSPETVNIQRDDILNNSAPPQASTTQDPIGNVAWHEGQVDFRELINSFETELIVHAMKLADGNKKEAARLLNLKRTTLLEKIKKKDLQDIWKK
ncbi:sigma-54 dependent transcriptional regulator [Desulfosediminicola flagellatus]|uniref:sigma-54 dependent transcriptional regulator n=1 Tax=Desulfosediminicola flagellatus TaxID=2569541 RepID=UPI0010AC6D69|nr:sigma-54 dependent transcriptional regulator [Desulfosediminicola flagellatus]